MRNMSNTLDKLSVLDSFIEEVNSYLPEIETNLERLSQTPGDMEALEETYRRTHTIGGSASMMDFPGLSHVAHGMEDILGDVLDGLAELDQPTIGLLQRSLERMHRLVDGIHHGIDEDAVIAEDDADYAQYRVLLETAARAGTSSMPGEGAGEQFKEAGVAASPALSMPSIDEVLASFRTPAAGTEEVISWPEEPAAVSYADVPSKQDSQPLQSPSQEFVQDQPQTPAELAQLSALEILAASSRQTSSQDAPPVTPQASVQDEWNEASTESTGKREVANLATPPSQPGQPSPEKAVLRQSRGVTESLFAKAYNVMHAQ